MRRALAVVLAVCCVVSGLVVAASADDSASAAHVATPSTNTSEYLALDAGGVETGAYHDVTLDASGTLALDTRGVGSRFEQLTLAKRFGATGSDTARRAEIRRVATRIERRISRLHTRQSAAISAYDNGSLSARGFVLELADIATTADGLGTAAGTVADAGDEVPGSTIDGQPAATWATNRRIELDPLEGPVRDRIGEALRGENTVTVSDSPSSGLGSIGRASTTRLEPLDVYVETAGDGVVLATVSDGHYYREAYVPAARNASAGPRVANITEAGQRAKAQYPWTWSHSGSTEVSSDQRSGIYEFSLGHEDGHLTTYLDGDSGTVFAEQQQKPLTGVPTRSPVSNRSGGLRLRVNRTYPTGPLELSLSTPDGDPVDGRVAVNGSTAGLTGPDGHYWTVAPRGPMVVVAHANGTTVSVRTTAAGAANATALGDPAAER